MNNLFFLSCSLLLSTCMYAADKASAKPQVYQSDMYMIFTEGERLASKELKSETQLTGDTVMKAVEDAFDTHEFISKETQKAIPYIITHQLHIENLPAYKKEGFDTYTNKIFHAMYKKMEDNELFPTVGKLDKSQFQDFDTKYQNGIIRRVGIHTYGERIGDGVVKLLAFFYDPAVLKIEGAADLDESDNGGCAQQ